MKHLQAVLAAVAAINEHDRPASPDDILVRVRNASQEVRDSIAYAEAQGYLEPAGRRGFWITSRGGDQIDAHRPSHVNPALLATASDVEGEA
jgi:hypothetical protein